MRSRRVTIVGMHYAPEPSGNAPYTSALAAGLARRGHQVRVLTGVPHYPAWEIFEGYDRWTSSESEGGVAVTRLKHYVPRRPSAVRRIVMEGSFGARAATRRWPAADVMICVSPALISTAVVAARAAVLARGTPLGLWVQDLYSLGVVEAAGAGRALAAATAGVEGRVARVATGVAVVHDRFGAYVTDTLGVPAERVSVIRNWTHLPPAATVDVAAIRRRLGWGEDTTVALHAGNMGVKQGLENVVEAARVAEREHRRVLFVLLGGGNQLEALQARAAGLSTVSVVPSLPGQEFQEALAAADVLLVNEKQGVSEMSVPSKLTSYYTSGRPVVAACAEGSVTDHEIQLSGGGFRVDPGAPESMLSAVLALGQDRDRAQTLGRSGQEFVRQSLSEERAFDRFESWIEDLITSSSRLRKGPHS